MLGSECNREKWKGLTLHLAGTQLGTWPRAAAVHVW